MRLRRSLILVALFSLIPSSRMEAQSPSAAPAGLRFAISFPSTMSDQPLDGRIILILAASNSPAMNNKPAMDNKKAPRFLVSVLPTDSAQIFGLDVDALRPGAPAIIDASTLGFPAESLAEIPPGDYWVQAVLNIYETFHLSTGHTVKLPPDRGEGQHWQVKPGNLTSAAQKIHVDPNATATISISLTQRIPPVDEEAADVDTILDWGEVTVANHPQDNKWVKHLRIENKRLSDFWGRPVFLEAIVLLPDGWEDHPAAHYPLFVRQDHKHRDFYTPVGFRTTPPTPDLKGDERTRAEYAYKFFQDWTSGRLPRVIIATIQHANPYYDDSYAVNSATLGPYGDAIVRDLIPYIEQKFRAIGQPWARSLYGGSTGGWETLASQIFYPDFYNGAWAACPDVVDFRAYQTVNLYEDRNAYWQEGPFGRVARGAMRTTDDHLLTTMEQMNRFELVLATKGRSGEQHDIWQAVFSPQGEDGYPKPIFNKRTGVIDAAVARYWREHYDLSHILERDWPTLGPRLVGKLHIIVGEMDTYYLNNAVHLMQNFLDTTTNPSYHGSFEYGAGRGHCYWGDPDHATEVGTLTINQRYLPRMVEHMEQTAPPGSDLSSWKY